VSLMVCVIIGVALWVAHLSQSLSVVSLSLIKGPCFFLEQETLPLLLCTGWFQERSHV